MSIGNENTTTYSPLTLEDIKRFLEDMDQTRFRPTVEDRLIYQNVAFQEALKKAANDLLKENQPEKKLLTIEEII